MKEHIHSRFQQPSCEDNMGGDSSNSYECPYCGAKMPEKDKAKHQSHECVALIQNSGVDHYDIRARVSQNSRSSDYEQKGAKPKTTDIREMMTPRSTRCRYCQALINADIVECHKVECLYKPIQCHKCFNEIILKGSKSHKCKGKGMKTDLYKSLFRKCKYGEESVSSETQMEEQADTCARQEDCGNLDTKVDPILLKHLKDLLLTGDDHDVVIKVRNQEFKAHKNMLRARSQVFAAMFRHEMKESADGTISIDDCDPDAFGEFLNYVYTGKVEDLSPKKAVGLYYAGDKYDFSGLKEVCVQFLEASLSTTSICDVINLATKHNEKELLENAIKFFTENTTKILVTVEWQRFAVSNFVAANELCIRAFKSLEKKK